MFRATLVSCSVLAALALLAPAGPAAYDALPLEIDLAEKEHVRMVLLEASVTDRRGRLVRGLEKRDFRVYENGVPHDIALFSANNEEPLSLAFLLDVSGSMADREKLERGRDAIRFLVGGLRPQDRFALACFADGQLVWITDFTQDRSAFLRRLEEQEPFGRTAMVDALALAPQLVDDMVRTRKAIVLISDAMDNSSRTPIVQAIDLARLVDVPLFTIALLNVDRSWLSADALAARLEPVQAVSEVTGGRVFAVYGDTEMGAALDLLQTELRSQYVIGYYAEGAKSEGEFRRVRLELGQRRLVARTRSGYYATR